MTYWIPLIAAMAIIVAAAGVGLLLALNARHLKLLWSRLEQIDERDWKYGLYDLERMQTFLRIVNAHLLGLGRVTLIVATVCILFVVSVLLFQAAEGRVNTGGGDASSEDASGQGASGEGGSGEGGSGEGRPADPPPAEGPAGVARPKSKLEQGGATGGQSSFGLGATPYVLFGVTALLAIFLIFKGQSKYGAWLAFGGALIAGGVQVFVTLIEWDRRLDIAQISANSGAVHLFSPFGAGTGPQAQGGASGAPLLAVHFDTGSSKVEGEAEVTRLKNLSRALSECAVAEPRIPVVLKVRGFASSADWKDKEGRPAPVSDEKNLKLAIDRANAVKELLGSPWPAAGEDGPVWPVRVEAENWDGIFGRMVYARPVIDRLDLNRASPLMERQNQVAIVYLADAARCRP